MQETKIEAIFIADEELFEARLVVRCEEFYPSRGKRLMVDVGRPVVRGVSPDAVSNQRESLIEWVSMEHEPGQPQVIAMPERGRRQLAACKRGQEIVVANFSRSNDDHPT